MKIAIIVGTRPQIIKSAPVFKAFASSDGVDCSIVNTGQHYDYEMNKAFFTELLLPEPETNLEVGMGSANQQVSKIVAGLDSHLTKHRPEIAIVPGDTNSAVAAGLACSKLGIRIAHLESGCRSNELAMAEEVNRRVLDQISHVLLCPTQNCVENLQAEQVLAQAINNVGDTMYDSILQCMPSIDRSDATDRLKLEKGDYAFMTMHRAEAVDSHDALLSIFSALGSVDTPIVFSVHPRTKSRIEQFGLTPPANVSMIEPLPYFDALKLVKDSRIVITDSGGLQKEAFWLKKPTLITRDRTEWMEIVRAGTARLVGTDRQRIESGFREMQHLDPSLFERSSKIFGDGHASEKVTGTVVSYVNRIEAEERLRGYARQH